MSQEIIELLQTESAVLLYFKNDTCQPCKVLRVKIEALIAESFPKIQFKVLDIGHHQDLISSMNVLSSPTILLFIEGKEFYRGGIYTSLDELKNRIERIYQILD